MTRVFLLCAVLGLFWSAPAFAQPAPSTIDAELQAGSSLVQTYQLRDKELRDLYESRAYKPVWNTDSKKGREGIQTYQQLKLSNLREREARLYNANLVEEGE